MRYMITLFFIFSELCFCQNNDIQIEYKMYCDTSIPLMYSSFLSINKNISIYEERFSTTQLWEGHPSEVPDVKVDRFRNAESHYLKIDNNKKEILFFDDIGSNVLLVQDSYSELAWDITNEAKTIAGLNCIKANINFRGRKWIAWFAPEIASTCGPWKLHGLPGLILEAYDETNRYIMKAVKIDFLKSNILKFDFTNLMSTNNKKPILYKQFLNDRDEFYTNMGKATASNNDVTLSEVKVPRSGMELIYEWEE